jgi:ABC-type antimicrobial peptide transport system permease subunit
MIVLVLFGAVAGALAAIGVYGMFSWIVALRTRELAIRLALGARPSAIGGIILRQSASLATVGLLAGLALVRAGEGALSRVLYEVSPSDVAALTAASLLLLVAALGAGLAPARRAMRVDPVEGLRAE